ncbi:MAG: ferrous iron transporter B [Candidatus Hadarchaeales archaeon]
MRVLLMGNPNVGKSVVFSRLTGTDVMVSNYPGTTVEFTRGRIRVGAEEAELIDVPGTYTLEPISDAEMVAARMLKEGDVVINVINATNLERNLYLTLQLLEKNVPVVVALNMWDEAKHKGIRIDVKKLERLLGVPVVPTVALTGEGIDRLVAEIPRARTQPLKLTEPGRWRKIGSIVKQVQRVSHRHHTLSERISDITIRPETGIPIAILIMVGMFLFVRLIGEGLSTLVMSPLFNSYGVLVKGLSGMLGQGNLIHDILIGRLVGGDIDFIQSMGLITTGLFVPFAVVLPYVFAFYILLGLLEDSGYLSRLGVLVDTGMHRIGMHGLGMVPMLLGMGCNVPGALSTRILETRRQRFIALTLLGVAIPCTAQLAMIFGLLGPYGVAPLIILFATLFLVWITLGLLLNRMMKGQSPEMFTEIPPYRRPHMGIFLKKLWMRTKSFLFEGVPFVLLGVLIANLLYSLGIIGVIGEVLSPVVVGLLGLPPEAAAALVVGFLRKDVAVGMLIPLGLSAGQLIVASAVLVMFFPCVATFAVFLKEIGIKDTVKASLVMMATAISVGTILRLLLQGLLEVLVVVILAVVAVYIGMGGKERKTRWSPLA